jgi:hypothetical protein
MSVAARLRGSGWVRWWRALPALTALLLDDAGRAAGAAAPEPGAGGA